MMAPTHRAMSSTWWLLGVAGANLAASGIHPAVAVTGALVAPVFGAGRYSPDADVTWLKRLGHRKATHRPDTTALALTGITALVSVTLALLDRSTVGQYAAMVLMLPAGWRIFRESYQVLAAYRLCKRKWRLPLALLIALGAWGGLVVLGPGQVAWLVWAPVTGWWSHLVGDAIFGRIPVGNRVGTVLERALPSRLIRRSSNGLWYVGVGLDTDGLIERGKRRLAERDPQTGLHKTVRVLPFAPTTLALQTSTAVLAVFVLYAWAHGGGVS